MNAFVLPTAIVVSMLAGSAKADTLYCSDPYKHLTLEAISYSGGAPPFPGMLLSEVKWSQGGTVVGHVRRCHDGATIPVEDECAAFTPKPFEERWSARQTLSYTSSGFESREVYAAFVTLHLIAAQPVAAYVICEEIKQFNRP